MRLAFVDDVESDLSTAADFVTNYIEKNHVELASNMEVSKYLSPLKFVEQFAADRFDLIVLDIFMKEMNGIQAAQHIRSLDRDCIIIFLTSTDAFLLEGYLVFASGYFIKPIADHAEDFRKTFDFILPRLLKTQQSILFPVLKSNDIEVPYENILYLDINEKHRVRVVTRSQEIISTMSYEEFARRLLTDKRFLECHYRIIVNMDRIENMLEEDFVVEGGLKVPMSHRKRKDAKWKYMQYLAHRDD